MTTSISTADNDDSAKPITGALEAFVVESTVLEPVQTKRPTRTVSWKAIRTSRPTARVTPVDPIAMWLGALATTLVAGLISIVGMVAAHALPGVDIVTPQGGASYAVGAAWHLTVGAIVAALTASILAHVLLLLVPRPFLFFRSIALLMTATVTLWPFTTNLAMPSKVATALVYLAIGASITGLLTAVARQARRDDARL